VIEVRNEGRDYMREMIRSAFCAEGTAVASAIAEELAYFGMLGFDGAFVSIQSGDKRSMETHMAQLTDALIAPGAARAASFRKATPAARRKREAKPAKDSVKLAVKRA
jgi:hypothetical protein